MAMAPKTSKELAELIADLHKENKPWHPCGLNTRMNWGPPITSHSQAISCREMKKVIHHAIDDLTITVEAGLQLTELQKILNERGQWLSLDWPWGSAPKLDPKSAGTIGGLIARGLSGSLRHKHLGVRDQLIGIGLIRSDGVEANAGGKVVKNVAGYDLMRLLCGSWGSLALITTLTLRTQPIKSAHGYLTISGKLTDIDTFRYELINSGYTVEYIDWKNQVATDWYIKIGLASVNSKSLREQIEGINKIADLHQLNVQLDEWSGPHLEDLDQTKLIDKINWLLRIIVPPSRIINLINCEQLNALTNWKWQFGAGTGLGEGWQESFSSSENLSTIDQIKELRNKITELGGQLLVLAQPLETNERIEAWTDAPSISLIKAVKQQFDPKSQIAIGRLPGVRS